MNAEMYFENRFITKCGLLLCSRATPLLIAEQYDSDVFLGVFYSKSCPRLSGTCKTTNENDKWQDLKKKRLLRNEIAKIPHSFATAVVLFEESLATVFFSLATAFALRLLLVLALLHQQLFRLFVGRARGRHQDLGEVLQTLVCLLHLG